MPETLTEFALRRAAELEKEIDALEARLAQLRVEKKELQIIVDKSSNNKNINRTAKEGGDGSLTIKEMVEKILLDKPMGLSALDILAELNRRFQKNLVRTSLSPQLSRLKADGVLYKDGISWRLS